MEQNKLPYELPGVPEKIEAKTFDYYQHKVGEYDAVIGMIEARYKDPEGKRCEAMEPGAELSHLTMYMLIKRFYGTPNKPVKEEILSDLLVIPKDESSETGKVQAGSLYFPFYLSIKKRDQWKNIRLFQDFIIGEDNNTRIIQVNPAQPSSKYVCIKNFPLYYGCPIKLSVEMSKNDKAYVGSVKQVNGAWTPSEEVTRITNEIKVLLDAEKEIRKAYYDNEEEPQIQSEKVQSNLDDILGEYGK